MMIGYIYKITNVANAKVYIGQTIDYDRRIKRHKGDADLHSRGFKRRGKLYNSTTKHGLHNFVFECIFVVLDAEDLNFFEMEFIREYDSFKQGYNCNIGGGSAYGFTHTEESKLKMSQNKRGALHHNYGKPLSEDHKQKLSVVFSGEGNPFYGKTHSEETVIKIKAANIGKVLSEETKQKMSGSRLGEKNPMYGLERPEVGDKNVETKGHRVMCEGVIYKSLRGAATSLNISRQLLNQWVSEGKATLLDSPQKPK